ncbi:hypothetical protein CAI16_10315 [Virgibacillus dokdonensis]|uniref:Phosphoglycolate phosphatase n=1 Tax=Virgibacillus dokdonensis TaxID=302167 RepID=A0A3E0WQT4_9BACI|nr:hypothetical protein CAI16_10315 [Virgibacillus dokdonensis]
MTRGVYKLNYKNIIFDFDGTLADSKQCSVLATQNAFKALRLHIPSADTIEHYMGIPIETSFKKMADRELLKDEYKLLLQTFREQYKQLESDLLTVFKNIPEVLHKMVLEEKLLFVLSSKKTDVLKRNLQSLNIDTYFHDIIGSDKVSHYKPHPDGILNIVEQYHLKKEETVMVGDAIYDLQMAKAAAISSCGVTWGSHKREQLTEEKPDHLIDEVMQLVYS